MLGVQSQGSPDWNVFFGETSPLGRNKRGLGQRVKLPAELELVGIGRYLTGNRTFGTRVAEVVSETGVANSEWMTLWRMPDRKAEPWRSGVLTMDSLRLDPVVQTHVVT